MGLRNQAKSSCIATGLVSIPLIVLTILEAPLKQTKTLFGVLFDFLALLWPPNPVLHPPDRPIGATMSAICGVMEPEKNRFAPLLRDEKL